MRAIKGVVLGAVLCLISPAYSQFKESINVELVSVPVYVSVHNEPVRGLTRDNFELLVNGKAQEIEYFDVTEFSSPDQAVKPGSSAATKAPAAAAPAVAAPAVATPGVAAAAPPAILETARNPLRERRLYMMVVDQALSSFTEWVRAKKAAASFVSQAGPSDFFALATFTGTNGMQVLLPFTNDRQVILKAIKKSSVSRLDPLHITLSETERSSFTATGEIASALASETQQSITDPTAAQDMQNQPYYNLGIGLMDGLSEIARQMAPLDGFKHVVFLGAVIPMRPYERSDVMRLRDAFQSAGVYLDTIDLGGLRPGYDVLKNIGEANAVEANGGSSGAFSTRVARRADMGEGLAPNPLLSVTGATSNVAARNGGADPSLYEVSATTGGQWIHNQSPGKGLQNLSKNQQVVYTLSFRPHDLGKHNTVSVRVRNVPAGAVVRYRQGFSKQQENMADNPLHLADIIINDTPQHGTPAAIRTIPTPGGVRVQVVVPIRLLAAQVSGTTNARVMFYVFNNTGAVGYGQRTILLDPGSRNDAVIQHVFKLSPGHYVAKAVLRLGDSQSVGFTREPFVVEK